LRCFVVLALAASVLCAAVSGGAEDRYVSTAPSITEMLFALGLGGRVVGVTNYCRYPEAAKKLPKVGTFLNPDLETIASLKPAIVFYLKNPSPLGERLRAMRLRTVELDPENISGIFRAIEQIGAATGFERQAAAMTSRLRNELDSIKASVANRPRPAVMYLVGRTPGTLEGMVAVGNGAYLNELLQYAGGRNVFASSKAPYPKVSLEEVLSRDPDVILDMGDMANPSSPANERQEAVARLWRKHPSLRAVKHNRVHALASDVFVVPGPRMVEAARQFRALLHPGLKP